MRRQNWLFFVFFFVNDTATTEIYTLSLHDALPIWGGISPLTIDYVNPEFPWPSIESVKYVTRIKGYNLRARLPIYPEFVKKNNDEFIPAKLRGYIDLFTDA